MDLRLPAKASDRPALRKIGGVMVLGLPVLEPPVALPAQPRSLLVAVAAAEERRARTLGPSSVVCARSGRRRVDSLEGSSSLSSELSSELSWYCARRLAWRTGRTVMVSSSSSA